MPDARASVAAILQRCQWTPGARVKVRVIRSFQATHPDGSSGWMLDVADVVEIPWKEALRAIDAGQAEEVVSAQRK